MGHKVQLVNVKSVVKCTFRDTSNGRGAGCPTTFQGHWIRLKNSETDPFCGLYKQYLIPQCEKALRRADQVEEGHADTLALILAWSPNWRVIPPVYPASPLVGFSDKHLAAIPIMCSRCAPCWATTSSHTSVH